ncbi:reverse transcriptase domain-containing protein [Tanacetum coccineum]
MPNHIKTYDGSEDQEDHLNIFQAAAKTKQWAMRTWCHMFNSTLTGNARVWFYDLPAESIDSYDDLKKAFLENFLQQKKYIKDPIELHNIKQRDRESIEDFVRRYKLESRDVKGAPECMRISGFVHGISQIRAWESQTPELIQRGKWQKAPNHERRNRFHHGNNKRVPRGKILRKEDFGTSRGKLSHLIKELKQNSGKEQPKTMKKGETFGKDKALAILMIQPWESVARKKITQSFSPNTEILFPLLDEDEGTEDPMIIEAEIGGHCIHRMVNTTTSEDWRRRALHFGLDELHGCKVTISLQQNYWKTRSQKITSSLPSAVLRNAEAPSRSRRRDQSPTPIEKKKEQAVQHKLLYTYLSQLWIFCLEACGYDLASPRQIREHLYLRIRRERAGGDVLRAVRKRKRASSDRKSKQHTEEVKVIIEAGNNDSKYTTMRLFVTNPVMLKNTITVGGNVLKILKILTSIPRRGYPHTRQIRLRSQAIFYYTKMPFGLRNAGATYQRLVDKAFHKQIGRNLKVYVDNLVIKIRTEDEIVRDIKETFKTLREINMKLNPKKYTIGVEEGMFLGYKVNTKGLTVCPDKVDDVLILPYLKCLKDVQKLNGKLASLNRFLAKSAEKSLPFFKTLKKCTKKSYFHWTTEAEEAFKKMKQLIAELPMLTAPMEKEELIVYLAQLRKT